MEHLGTECDGVHPRIHDLEHGRFTLLEKGLSTNGYHALYGVYRHRGCLKGFSPTECDREAKLMSLLTGNFGMPNTDRSRRNVRHPHLAMAGNEGICRLLLLPSLDTSRSLFPTRPGDSKICHFGR